MRIQSFCVESYSLIVSDLVSELGCVFLTRVPRECVRIESHLCGGSASEECEFSFKLQVVRRGSQTSMGGVARVEARMCKKDRAQVSI